MQSNLVKNCKISICKIEVFDIFNFVGNFYFGGEGGIENENVSGNQTLHSINITLLTVKAQMHKSHLPGHPGDNILHSGT